MSDTYGSDGGGYGGGSQPDYGSPTPPDPTPSYEQPQQSYEQPQQSYEPAQVDTTYVDPYAPADTQYNDQYPTDTPYVDPAPGINDFGSVPDNGQQDQASTWGATSPTFSNDAPQANEGYDIQQTAALEALINAGENGGIWGTTSSDESKVSDTVPEPSSSTDTTTSYNADTPTQTQPQEQNNNYLIGGVLGAIGVAAIWSRLMSRSYTNSPTIGAQTVATTNIDPNAPINAVSGSVILVPQAAAQSNEEANAKAKLNTNIENPRRHWLMQTFAKAAAFTASQSLNGLVVVGGIGILGGLNVQDYKNLFEEGKSYIVMAMVGGDEAATYRSPRVCPTNVTVSNIARTYQTVTPLSLHINPAGLSRALPADIPAGQKITVRAVNSKWIQVVGPNFGYGRQGTVCGFAEAKNLEITTAKVQAARPSQGISGKTLVIPVSPAQ